MQSELPKCLGVDFSGVEKRVLLRLTNDLHKERASRIFSVPEEEVTEGMRMHAKQLYYLEIYGGLPKWMI